LPSIISLDFDKYGNGYVSDSFNRVIWKVPPNGVSTPGQKCIGWPEQKYISDAGKKAPELGPFPSGIKPL
jgi:hypothetical protein